MKIGKIIGICACSLTLAVGLFVVFLMNQAAARYGGNLMADAGAELVAMVAFPALALVASLLVPQQAGWGATCLLVAAAGFAFLLGTDPLIYGVAAIFALSGFLVLAGQHEVRNAE